MNRALLDQVTRVVWTKPLTVSNWEEEEEDGPSSAANHIS
jgi:hypothetical protein